MALVTFPDLFPLLMLLAVPTSLSLTVPVILAAPIRLTASIRLPAPLHTPVTDQEQISVPLWEMVIVAVEVQI